jgi:hypothetical protein
MRSRSTGVDRGKSAGTRRAGGIASAVLAAGLLGAIQPREVEAQVVLPPPERPGFPNAFDLRPNGRLLAFSGSVVREQKARGSAEFRAIGELPTQFQGVSDPLFALDHGRFLLLGVRARVDAPPLAESDGGIFVLPRAGGEAALIAVIPGATRQASVYGNSSVLIHRQIARGLSGSAIEHLSVPSGAVQTAIANIPSPSAGVAADRKGNVFVGLALLPVVSERAGEIRRFSRAAVQAALRSGVPLDFEADGVFVARVLTGEFLVVDREGDLWVGGGDIFDDTVTGYFAEVDPSTGEILRRLDPADGDPDSGPPTLFRLSINDPLSCRIAADDGVVEGGVVYEIDACPGPRRP